MLFITISSWFLFMFLVKANESYELIDVSHLITACNERLSREDLNNDELLLTSCSCDSKCVNFGDCCLDKLTMNGIARLDYVPCQGNTRWGFSTYVKNKCKNDWNDTSIRGLCEGTIFSTFSNVSVTSFFSGLTYSNLFCAICNDEMEQDIEFWISEFNCQTEINQSEILKVLRSIYRSASLNLITSDSELLECDLNFKNPSSQLKQHLRNCHPAISLCPKNWKNSQIERKCFSYTSYVVGQDENNKDAADLYRNPHCALCHGIKVENMRLLTEWNELVEKSLNDEQLINANDIEENAVKHRRQINSTNKNEKDQAILYNGILVHQNAQNGTNSNISTKACGPLQVLVEEECVDFNVPLEDISDSLESDSNFTSTDSSVQNNTTSSSINSNANITVASGNSTANIKVVLENNQTVPEQTTQKSTSNGNMTSANTTIKPK